MSMRLSATMRATARRLSWGLADQAVSSLTNFAVGLFVARTLGASAFGAFALAWVTYAVAINVSRGLATDPLMVRYSGVPVPAWRAAVVCSSGTALCVGLAAGAACLLAGLAIGGTVGAGFTALGIVLPALLVQDSWRYAFFAVGVGRKAFANDLVWAAALVPGMALAAGHGTVFGFVLAWGTAAAVAAAYGCLQTRLLPRAFGIGSWLRQQRDLGPHYMTENVTNSGAAQLRMYGLGAIAGLADAGAMRGAELVMAPFLALLMGVSLFAVPEAARVLRRAPHRLVTFCLALGGGQAAAAASWGLAVLLLLPDAAGRFVLDEVWAPASALLLPVTLTVTAAGLIAGAQAGLRALGLARRSLRAQLATSAGYLSGGLAGAAYAGALGAAWGSTTGIAMGVAMWWCQLRAGLREKGARAHSETGADTAAGHAVAGNAAAARDGGGEQHDYAAEPQEETRLR